MASFMNSFKASRKISNTKSERLCALWARGNALSSGSTVEDKTYILAPADDAGQVWELKSGNSTNMEKDACKTVVGTFTAPEKDTVQTSFKAELFTTSILRGMIKVGKKQFEATAFLSSKEEIEAKSKEKGLDPARYPIAYILYQEPLPKKEKPMTDK